MTTRSLWMEVAGLTIEVRGLSVPASFMDQLEELWEQCLLEERPDMVDLVLPLAQLGPWIPVDPDGHRVFSLDAHHSEAGYKFSGELTLRLLQTLVGSKLLLHAGAVHVEQFGLLLATGPSGAGKSTAITTLGAHGLYATDELSVMDLGTFALSPYPKPLSRVESSGGDHSKRDISLAEAGIDLVLNSSAETPRHVVIVNREAWAELPSCEAVGLAEALVVLASQSSSIWLLENPLGTLVDFVQSLDGMWRATYQESTEILELLEQGIAREGARLRENYELLDPIEHAAPEQGSGLWHLTPAFQSVWVETGEVVTLTRGDEPHVVALSGVGAVAWDVLYADGPQTFESLLALVIETAGEHPQAAEFLTEALEAGEEQGVFVKA